MNIDFVYRGNTAGLSCKHVHRIEAQSILEVFQTNWQPVADPEESEMEVIRHGEAIFGPGYNICLHGMAFEIFANRWPAPESLEELHHRMEEMAARDVLRGLTLGTHHIAILDTDDVYEEALYIFDDDYAAEHPERVAFLLQDGWELPDGEAGGPFEPATDCQRAPDGDRGKGCTFIVVLKVDDHWGLTNLGYGGCEGCWRVAGVRLPDLPLYLFKRASLQSHEEDPWEIRALAEGLRHFATGLAGMERAFLDAVRSDPDGEPAWMAYSDWLVDQGRPTAGIVATAELLRRCPPSRWYDADKRPEDLVVAHAHMAQACKRLGVSRGREESYHHIILFDDRWASAHPDLANSILRFATRWDVL